MRQSLDTVLFNDSRILEDVALVDQYSLRNHRINVGQQMHEGWHNCELKDDMSQGVDDSEPDDIEGLQHNRDAHDAKSKICDINFPGKSKHNEDVDDSIRDDMLRCEVAHGWARYRERTIPHEGVNWHMMSSLIRNLNQPMMKMLHVWLPLELHLQL